MGEEKIDIILFNEDKKQYIINALSPAKVAKVILDKKVQRARVLVPDDQFSLAIGTGGQNVRLASKLTGWSLDFEKVEEAGEKETEVSEETVEVIAPEKPKKTKTTKKAKKVKEAIIDDISEEPEIEKEPVIEE
jgi:N utilization substance protein A